MKEFTDSDLWYESLNKIKEIKKRILEIKSKKVKFALTFFSFSYRYSYSQ